MCYFGAKPGINLFAKGRNRVAYIRLSQDLALWEPRELDCFFHALYISIGFLEPCSFFFPCPAYMLPLIPNFELSCSSLYRSCFISVVLRFPFLHEDIT